MPEKRSKSFNYAIGMFGTSIPINMLKTFAFTFYVLGLGVTTTQWAAMMLIYTFIDALDNPVYGFLSDRTRSRCGRRRPWLAIGTPILILCFVAFYNIPAFLSGNTIFAYAMLFYILTGTLDSVINANYGALFPELFRDDASRAKTNALRQAFQLVAMIISIALTPMVTKALGYGLTSIIYDLTEELPRYLADVFGLKPRREDTFIAGNSMGGYGAFKAALLHPELYAAASFSGVLSLEILELNPDDRRKQEFALLFGDLDKLSGSEHDPAVWLQRAAQKPADLPHLFIAVGLRKTCTRSAAISIPPASRWT